MNSIELLIKHVGVDFFHSQLL